MDYCTTDDVITEFKDITFDCNSSVKLTDVESFIVQCSALIDSYVSRRYTIPVKTGDGVEVLKLICESMVAERIRGILETKQISNKDGNQAVRRLFDWKTCLQMLKDIASGNLVLIGAPLISTSGGIYSENAATGVKPYFRMGKKQW